MKKILKSSLLFSFLVLLILPLSTASAQTKENGPSLAISPVIFDINLKPGENTQKLVSVINNSENTVTIITEVADFTYDSEGDMKFIEEKENNPGVSSLKKWLSYSEKEFSLGPREKKDVLFTINAPLNSEPGAHYGVIFFKNKPAQGSSIGVSARVGALLLVTLPGNVTKTGNVSDFIVGTKNAKNKVDPTSFFSTGPIDFSFIIKNTGNVHFKPEGTITITDMFGNIVKEISPMDTRAFPGAKRTYIQSADIQPWGMYKATLNLKDGDGKNMESLMVSFWGFNYKLVIQWLIILVVIFFVLRFGIKRYNAWIIKQAKGKK